MRLNSIGMKLGFASLTSIALSLGMAANQLTTERSINVVNARADALQMVADHGLEANVALRRMQLAAAELRLAATPAQLEAAVTTLHDARETADRQIAIAVAQATDGAEKERLQSIGTLASQYDRAMTEAGAVIKSVLSGTASDADKARRDQLVSQTQSMATQALGLMREAVDRAEQSARTTKKQASDELFSANRINFALGMLVMTSLVISMVFTFFGISRPLMRLNGALGKMAGGELDVEIPGAARGDEIGDIAKTVVVIRENADHRAREETEQKAHQDEMAALQRKQEMQKLADAFEGAVGRIVEAVSSASTELEASASKMAHTAEEAEKLTAAVAGASEIATSNVQSVASATEEMASSIHEISRQVQDSSRIASSAVQQANKTNDRINQLATAAQRIGDVVDLINTIAGQTNLLALNATIEAARAGEAGRGFAVVAAEVKALAEQTAKATDEISQQISGMQSATEESVSAIKEIGTTIGQMSEISSAIASAVEQQGSATQEISRNVQQAAQGTMQVSANIADVERGAAETGMSSSQVLAAARSLSSDSTQLKTEVARFLSSVRAA
ncbi:methyl-accepting chemotaxis protein [Rhodopseudomonas thermotolerans]|uniref:Methyl-accepting chemotaxis protein n=2 Tax=Rhodopseudomonas TaxID=1073 RepID=A0A336JQM6_9BRAD|nr:MULTISPECIES: HAMP domain-containing methyl-accepting chemotaxis protein [Rhodopseudomonas]RED30504.1 methyl-accepting chemotaxis protein [Rhodopseudomonas pentothenatexigens]REF92608.1 methyl-accepting chemotaxis protein [Rhodopseudomonas thermotolerans]SSW92037.1 methyl-accepting chemotaxis protein [Rhodopseudomonas pentothenatexigens]